MKATISEMKTNVLAGEKIYKELIKKGYSPILPHFSFYTWQKFKKDMNMTWQMWIDLDKEYIKESDHFFYMVPEEYGESKGAQIEFEMAKKLGKKIYLNLNEVPDETTV